MAGPDVKQIQRSSAIEIEPRMGLAYNNRALSRAIASSELVDALADSDQALKLLPLNLEVRDTRGFIYLKRGEFDRAIADYEAGLRLDPPNKADFLYGRGLARTKKGDAGGDADIAAAKAITPHIAEDFAKYGVK